jgi:hypothetical protein
LEFIKNEDETELIKKYRKYGDGLKSFIYISSLGGLNEFINTENYFGTMADLFYISKMFKLNIIVLEKRVKKGMKEFIFIKGDKEYESKYFIVLMRTAFEKNYQYSFVDNKGKILFKMDDFPSKFISFITEGNSNSNSNSRKNANSTKNVKSNANSIKNAKSNTNSVKNVKSNKSNKIIKKIKIKVKSKK